MLRMVVWCAIASGCGFQVSGSTDAPPLERRDAAVTDDAPGGDAALIDARMLDAAPDAPPAPPVSLNVPITADTYVDSLAAQSTFGTAQSILVDGGTTPATSLLRADFSAIPATATVTAAELHIWTSTDTGSTVNVYKMLEAWDENAATVSQRMTGVAWSGQGAAPPSRDTTSLGTINPSTQTTEKTVMNLAALVQGWVTTPATNRGIAIASSQSDGSTYRSREDTTTARRPYFAITYQP